MKRWVLRTGLLVMLAGLAGTALLFFIGRARAAATCNVDHNGGQYTTIQAAIDANCTTINIANGQYDEQVILINPNNLTYHLNGSGGGTVIKHPAPGGGTKQIDGADYVVALLSADTTIQNLTIDGGGYSCQQKGTCQAGQMYGIHLGASNDAIQNITFQNIGDPTTGNYDGSGIGLDTSGDITLFNHKQDYRTNITGSTFSNLTRSAVRVRTEGSIWGNFANIYFGGNQVNGRPGMVGFENVPHQSVLENNTFSNITKGGGPGPWAGTAVVVGNDDKECINIQYIRTNTFNNNDVGVWITGSDNDSVTTNNTFNGGGTAIKLVGNLSDYSPYGGGTNPIDCKATHATRLEPIFFLPALGQWQYYPIRQDIMNNQINNPGGDGVQICSDNYVTVSGNTISGAAGSAIHVCAGGYGSMLINNNTNGGKITDATGGNGSLGTANYYSGNTCGSSTPGGLCGYNDGAVGPNQTTDPNWYISVGNCTWYNGNNYGNNGAGCPGNNKPANGVPTPPTPTPIPPTATPIPPPTPTRVPPTPTRVPPTVTPTTPATNTPVATDTPVATPDPSIAQASGTATAIAITQQNNPPANPPGTSGSNTMLIVGAVVVAILALLVAGGLAIYLRSRTPAAGTSGFGNTDTPTFPRR